MISILTFLISITPCDRFMQKMAHTNNLIDAKLQIILAKKSLDSKELDKGIMVLLHRIHDHETMPNGLYTTQQERESMTRFLFKVAREK